MSYEAPKAKKWRVDYDGRVIGWDYGHTEKEVLDKLMQRNPNHLRHKYTLICCG